MRTEVMERTSHAQRGQYKERPIPRKKNRHRETGVKSTQALGFVKAPKQQTRTFFAWTSVSAVSAALESPYPAARYDETDTQFHTDKFSGYMRISAGISADAGSSAF